MKRLPDPRALAGLLVCLASLGALAGCVANPVAVAETPAQKAYALERAYNIVLENAVDVAEDPATPPSVREDLQAIEADTTPVVDELSAAFADYEVIAAQVAAGTTPAERLNTAAANLEDWIARAQRALVRLNGALDR